MPAKKTRKPPGGISDFAAHVEASNKAYEWTSMAVEYRKAGNLGKAMDAERRAKAWLAQALRIEERSVAAQAPAEE